MRHLKTRMIVLLWGASALLLAALSVMYYHTTSKRLLKEIDSQALTLATEYAREMSQDFRRAQQVPESLAAYLSQAPELDMESIRSRLENAVTFNSSVFGSAVAFEPNRFSPERHAAAPFCYLENGSVACKDLEKEYDYFQSDWYKLPRGSRKASWSEPYFDKGGANRLMITYSVPFFRGGELAGVATADVLLETLTADLHTLKIGEEGYGFLVNARGLYLATEDHELIMNKTVHEHDPGLGEVMLSGETGLYRRVSQHLGVETWVAYTPLKTSGFYLGIAFIEDEILSDLKSLVWVVSGLAFVGLVFLLLIIILISRSITRPIEELVSGTEIVARGDFGHRIEVRSGTAEIKALTGHFNTMIGKLAEYIETLRETTAAKERIQGELRLATEIQASLLPRIFPAYPDRKEIDIFASMHPAKEVGGDLYDFFFIDEHRLFFVIGDVSDKGVPAALYMMITKTLLKNEALRGLSPEEILTQVNNCLARDNESCMFVTVFCGVLDTRNGELVVANGGHNPPVMSTADDCASYMKIPPCFVVGPMADMEYESIKLTMKPGDIIFLYTDGVTEAMNPKSEIYGEERLLDYLSQHCQKGGPEAIVGQLHDQVAAFADGAQQSDDIAMLAVRYNGPKK